MGILNGEPHFTLNTENGKVYCDPDNTIAFVHGENFRDVDHIFRYNLEDGEIPDDEDMVEGMFAFRAVFSVLFNPIVQDMEELGFTVVHHDIPTDPDWEQYLVRAGEDLDEYWVYLDGTDE